MTVKWYRGKCRDGGNGSSGRAAMEAEKNVDWGVDFFIDKERL